MGVERGARSFRAKQNSQNSQTVQDKTRRIVKLRACKDISWLKSKRQGLGNNVDMSLIFSDIKGVAETCLEKMGDLVYSYGKEKFVVKEQISRKDMPRPTKSHCLQEIQ